MDELPFSKKKQSKKPRPREKAGLNRKEERKIEKKDQFENHDTPVYELVKERSFNWVSNEYECENCDNPIGNSGQMAHTVPRSRGGLATEENLKYLCLKCHFEQDHHLRIR